MPLSRAERLRRTSYIGAVDPIGYRLSVDFGTSNTVAVIGHRGADARPLLFDGSPTLRSAVFLDASNGLLVGRDAERSARTSPDRFEPNPKRRVDEPAVLLGDAEIPVVDLIAAVLRRVATEARRVAGGAPIGSVTLTYPAAWAHTRRQVLTQAAHRAGIPPTSMVPEPVAAAHSFLALAGGNVPVGASVLVYDLGAGTFDASVVRRGPNGFDVVAAEGLAQGGGLDIDAAIVAYLAAVQADRAGELWSRLLNPTTPEERRANRLLWDDVRTAKEQLSRASQTVIHVPLSGDDVPLGREQLERLARPILDATIATTRLAVNNARVGPSEVAGVFLVGGGSRIPLVTTLLHQAFQHAPAVTEQPELVVAEGGLRGPAATPPQFPATPAPQYPATPAPHYPAPHYPAPQYPAPQYPATPPAAQPVSAPPNHPVSAQPVSGQPAYQPPPQPAHPLSAAPANPVSTPAPPYAGGAPPYTAPPYASGGAPPYAAPPYAGGGAAPPPQPAPVAAGGRRGRGGLVAIGIALAVVLVLGAIPVVLLLLPDDGGKKTGDDPPAGRSASVNRILYSSGGHTVTLATLTVSGGKLRVNMRYENRSSAVWNLRCPDRAEDLRSSWVTVAGRQVYPDDSWCVQTHPGQGVTIDAGDAVDSWGQYPVVPERGRSFSLQWYDLPAATGLTV
jgi:hypothetical protein